MKSLKDKQTNKQTEKKPIQIPPPPNKKKQTKTHSFICGKLYRYLFDVTFSLTKKYKIVLDTDIVYVI